MADDIKAEITEAQQAAKLEILRRIAVVAPSSSAPSLQALGYAYSLVVGAAPAHLPGGPLSVNVSN